MRVRRLRRGAWVWPEDDAVGQAEGALDNGLSAFIFTAGNRPARRRYFGTRWCGPGGAGSPDGRIDAACHLHDLCLNAAGLDASVNTNSSIHLSLPQAAAALVCNQSLFNAVRQYPDEAGSYSIQKWLLYGDLFGILAPGTAVR
jgi:hypothetical protein